MCTVYYCLKTICKTGHGLSALIRAIPKRLMRCALFEPTKSLRARQLRTYLSMSTLYLLSTSFKRR